MKKKSALIFGLMFIGMLSLGTRMVWGEMKSLPKVTTACESKTGLLMVIDDGFSILKKCPKNFRKVTLGETTTTGGVEDSNDLGIVFSSQGYFLKENGQVWLYSPGDTGELEWAYYGNIPVGVNDIYQWDQGSFLTKDGVFYVARFSDSKISWEIAESIPSEIPTVTPTVDSEDE